MNVIIVGNEYDWRIPLYDYLSDKVDTYLIPPERIEEESYTIDPNTVIVCDMDVYLEHIELFDDKVSLAIFVIIDKVYFDPYDPKFMNTINGSYDLYIIGNSNNVENKRMFQMYTHTFWLDTINPNDITSIANEIMKVKPQVNLEIDNTQFQMKPGKFRYRVGGVKITGIFSNAK